MNKNAERFVRALKASIEGWRMPEETRALFTAKLSKWDLSETQWNAVLDRVIAKNLKGELPQLAAIEIQIKNELEIAREPSPYGWLSFDWKGHSYAMRVKSDGYAWLIADLMRKDEHGQIIHLQKNVGEPAALHLPAGAENVIVSPDNPADPQPEEMPSKREVAEYRHEFELVAEKMKM